MPKFLVTVTGYRQFVVEAKDQDFANLDGLEAANGGGYSSYWQAEEASSEPLADYKAVAAALRHGAKEI